MSPRLWWCDACGCTHEPSKGWFSFWRNAGGGCGVKAEANPDLMNFDALYREVYFACGQGTALLLFQRFIETGGFAKASELPLPSPAVPAPTGAMTENF